MSGLGGSLFNKQFVTVFTTSLPHELVLGMGVPVFFTEPQDFKNKVPSSFLSIPSMSQRPIII